MSDVENTQEDFLDVNEEGVEDEAGTDNTVAPLRYDITSYGADYDVEGIVKRLERAVSRSTSNETFVSLRLRKATECFVEI